MNILQATHTKIFKPKYLLGLLLLFCAPYFFAQKKLLKLEQEFTVSSIPDVVLNSSHNNIILSTWDKNVIKILAYSSGDVDQNSLKIANDLWRLNVQQSDSLFVIDTDASKQLPQKVLTTYKSNTLNNVNDSTEVLPTSLSNISFSNSNNVMPKVLQDRINESKFNFEAYQSLGDTYFKIWEYNLVKGLDNAAAQQVKNWYSQMVTELINVSVSNQENTSLQGVFNESFKKKNTPLNSIKKIIEITIPKKSLSQLNTRFGKVSVTSPIKNLKARLKYSDFEADFITGNRTNISIASAPVTIKNWNDGFLQLKYVKNSSINIVNNLKLNAVSSRLVINEFFGNGEFKNTFSQLVIEKTNATFNNLSFLNTNSDLILNLPSQAYNFVYSGEMSGIKIPPNKLQLKSLGDYRKLMLHGYSKTRNTDKEIQMNMVNSQILLK